jgi:hypothetical protein
MKAAVTATNIPSIPAKTPRRDEAGEFNHFNERINRPAEMI